MIFVYTPLLRPYAFGNSTKRDIYQSSQAQINLFGWFGLSYVEVIVIAISPVVSCFIVRKMDKELKEQLE